MTYVRNHGFCGEWICNLDTPMVTSDVPKPDAPAQTPEWLPSEWVRPYLSYLQQYTHNINLLRWFLDAGDQAQVKVVDLDDNGYSGVVIFDMAGVRVTLETGRFHTIGGMSIRRSTLKTVGCIRGHRRSC